MLLLGAINGREHLDNNASFLTGHERRSAGTDRLQEVLYLQPMIVGRRVDLRESSAILGLEFGEQCQLLRSTGPFDPIRDALDLGVGYGSSTVNRHRIELFLIDRAGMIVDSRLRRLWQAQEVADMLLAV